MRNGEGRCEFRGEGDGFSGIPKWHQEGNEELGRGKETWNKEKEGIVGCSGAYEDSGEEQSNGVGENWGPNGVMDRENGGMRGR